MADDAGVPPALLSDEQAAAFYGVSPRTFHSMRGQPFMPAPIQLGVRLLKWSRVELEEAIAKMPRVDAPSPEPKQLLRGRIERAKKTGHLS